MTPIDTRFVAYLVWGVGTLIVYGIVLARRRETWQRHRDARARRDLIEGLAEFVVSLAAFIAITFVLFGDSGSGIRGLSAAVALGAFFAAGVVKVTDKPVGEP